MISPAGAISASEIDAVVFDIGGVILLPNPAPMRPQLEAHGLTPPADDADYHRAHYAAMRAMHEMHTEALEFDETVRASWEAWDRGYLTALFADTDAPDTAAGVDALIAAGIDRSWDWRMDEAVVAMQRLEQAGIPQAIVSNNDGTADQQMLDHDVAQVGPGPLVELVTLVDSGVAGIAKPDPRIFAPALVALGLPPERVLYVGDTVHADVRGARAAGLPVVQIDPYDHHADLDHPRAVSVSAVADHLLD